MTGFLGARIDCPVKTRLWFVFDEILSDDVDVDFRRLGCCNIVDYVLEPGTYDVESIEPYTARYVKLVCLEGGCTIGNVYLREYAYPEITTATFRASDPRLNKLFDAGVQTFRQNSLDIFMDCPSRERAGWLCDSFFTARVEHDLAGTVRVERNFVENFLLPDGFKHLPDGMLPMCYPADQYNGRFIPNWSMWFVVQLEEYAARSGDRATIDALRPKVLRLLDYFKKFENADGLLEKLDSWVFVEWSAANDFVQDVNYPSNMLYAGMLSAAGAPVRFVRARFQGRCGPRDDPQAVVRRAILRRQRRPQGRPLAGHAQSERGLPVLRLLLRRRLDRQPRRFVGALARPVRTRPQTDEGLSEVHMANSFIGNMLRIELLSRAGHNQQILDESIAYLSYMADRTGTLWENTGAYASCNHGFASHIVHTLYRDVLGLYRVDTVNKDRRLAAGRRKARSVRRLPADPGRRRQIELAKGRRHADLPTESSGRL